MTSVGAVAPAPASARTLHVLGLAALGLLLALLVVHAAGVGLDWAAAIRFPYQIDYGEGIVWQQAELIPGPRAYELPHGLPFIVFHYPPVYYFLVKLAQAFEPDLLAAGRLVSVVCTILIAPATAALALVGGRRPGRSIRPIEIAIAAATGLLPLSLHAVRAWGMLMRVDMPSILLPLIAILVAVWAEGRFWGTVSALALCTLAVFTKQTQLTAGVAVFVAALLRSPRNALGAAILVGAAGLAVVAWLQGVTDGGFLQNTVLANVNQLALRHAYWALWPERSIGLIFLLSIIAAAALLGEIMPSWRQGVPGVRRDLQALRQAGRATTCRLLLLLYFALSGAMLVTMFKSGASFNYLLGWLTAGCALIGVWLTDLSHTPRPRAWTFPAATAALALTVAVQHFRVMPDNPDLQWREALVARIAAAPKPVASDDMVLLLRAGKQVVFEPAIVHELATVGRWDERPLLDMIRANGFAFFLVNDNTPGATPHRTAEMDAAMRAAYPVEEQVGPNLWMMSPKN